MATLRRAAEVQLTFARTVLGGEGPLPHRVRRALEDLGPTYVKAGQVIASSPGLFPPEWIEEFATLRDAVPPFEAAEAVRIVEEDLARPVESAFAEFDPEPIAAASIGQVHPAVLRDGERVVVKVQRPDLDRIVGLDLRGLFALCEVLDRLPLTSLGSPLAIAEDFARTLHEEMDYRVEVDHMERMRAQLVDMQIEQCIVPLVHHDLCNRRVLTMERIDGFRFHDVEAMREAGIDTHTLLRIGVQTVVEGVLMHGFFHGDLHAGNIIVLPDGRFALIDFGIVGRLTESVRARLADYILASVTNDYESMIHALDSFGSIPQGTDIPAMAAEIQAMYEPFVQNGVVVAQLGELMETMIRSMVRYQVRIPRELVLLSKQMVYLEGAAHSLAPDIDLLEEQQVIVGALVSKYPQLGQQMAEALARGTAAAAS